MRKTPEDCLEEVVDEATFIDFLRALADDWEEEREIEKAKPSSPYGPGALGWENGSIGTFLDAAIGWGLAWKEEREKLGANPWRRAAEILLAGKYYE